MILIPYSLDKCKKKRKSKKKFIFKLFSNGVVSQIEMNGLYDFDKENL